jgi:hypothetical protein
MELQLQNKHQVKIADLLWEAQDEASVNLILAEGLLLKSTKPAWHASPIPLPSQSACVGFGLVRQLSKFWRRLLYEAHGSQRNR